jgi:hypothetical protein
VDVSAAARFSGIEARRSTRVDRNVPLVIMGQTKLGLSFEEKTSAVSVNLHGCRYPSRHDYSIGSWVALQVLDGENNSAMMRAQVRSIHPPMSPREMYQIGVELEAPANVWGVSALPDDWQRILGGGGAKAQMATGAAPARAPAAAPTLPQTPVGPEYRNAGVAAFPGPPAAAAAKPEFAKELSAVKPERVVITSDQLIAAVQGKLQQAAEKAVHAAITTHLVDAVRKALGKIDDVCNASVHQMEQYSAQRLETMMRSTREEVLSRIDARLVDDRSRWTEQQESYRSRAEEVAQRIEKLAEQAQQNLAEAQKFTDRITGEVEPQVRGRVERSVTRATEEFEAAATRVADRQLVRLMEDKQMVTREAASQMAACAAEMRALLQTSASGTLEEFRRQTEMQVDLAISEATQRVMSSLASLDAENRAACEARRRSIESDVARATEQSTEQFRTGIKAFLYSCLVAAVGAVDEHAKTTFEGLVKDQGKVPRELGRLASGPEKGDVAPPGGGDPGTN